MQAESIFLCMNDLIDQLGFVDKKRQENSKVLHDLVFHFN